MPIYNGYHLHGQGNCHQTHSNHDEHVETIEKGRDHLVEACFSRGDSTQRVTSYSDHLRKN
jgi:hypothetical protein